MTVRSHVNTRRIVVRAGRDVGRGDLPERTDHPHLLGVGEPGLAPPLRPDRAVQPAPVGGGPVLRAADRELAGSAGHC